MSISGRALSLLGLLAFGPGVVIYALTASVVCFDVCPQDLSGTLARTFLVWVGPGFVLSWLTLALALPSNADTGRWTRFAFVLGVLLLSGGGMIAFWLRASQGGVFPSQEDQLYAWITLVWRGVLPFAAVFSLVAFGVQFTSPRTPVNRLS